MEKHIQVIGILWIVLGVIGLGLGLLALLVGLGVSFIPEFANWGDLGDITPEVFRIIIIAVCAFIGVFSVPKIIAGIGLLRKREWARIMILVLSFLELWSIPFGLALAVYSMVILFKPETIKLFNPSYQTPAAPSKT